MILRMLENPAAAEEMVEACRQMVAHAACTPSQEVCGFLMRLTDSKLMTAVQCRNISEVPERSFEMNPADQRLVYAENGWEVLGVYHSHPGGDPTPSKRDVKFWPLDLRYFIVAQEQVYEYTQEGQ